MLDRYLIDVYRHVADSLPTLNGHSTTEATHNQLLVDWLSTANRLPFGLHVDRLSNNISSYLLIDLSVDTSFKECKLCQIRAELYHTFSNKILHSLPCKRNTFSLLKARKKHAWKSFLSVAGKHALSEGNPPEDDTEVYYQRGSVMHPAHEMYPMCHHCPTNSSYEDCAHKRTLRRCDNGLSNICFTKSSKRGNIVHYNMGCANHKQCQRARATPCKGNNRNWIIYPAIIVQNDINTR